MTVAELLQRISSHELSEWGAFLELEAEDEARREAEQKAAQQHQANRRKGLR